MIEPGSSLDDRTLRAGVQYDELAPRRPQPDLGPIGSTRRQPDVVPVETERAVAVGDGKLDCAHTGFRGDRLRPHPEIGTQAGLKLFAVSITLNRPDVY